MSRSTPTGFTMRGEYLQRYLPDHPMALADGYVPEHRLVMSNHLGRILLPSEQVHHKDEDTTNNEPDNLEIKNLTKHVTEHWAERRTSCKYCGADTCSKISACKRCWDIWSYRHKKDNKKHNREICPFCV